MLPLLPNVDKELEGKDAFLKQKVISFFFFFIGLGLFYAAFNPSYYIQVMGVMVHGIGTYIYIASPPVKFGTNFNIECLQMTLNKVAALRGGKLPPILYLQMGKTIEEGKF